MPSLADAAIGELLALGVAIGASSEQRAVAGETIASAISSAGWANLAAGVPVPWCRISHQQPYGLSFSGGALRFMLEPRPQGPPTEAAFEQWLGASIDRAGTVTHKRYLPLTGAGPDRAVEQAQLALDRFGFGDCWPVPAFRPGRDLPTILGIDRGPRSERVKLYVLHRGARASELSTPGARDFASVMLGGDPRLWWLECTWFESGRSGHVLHLGVPRHIPDSGEARTRCERYLGARLPVDWPLHFVSSRPAVYFLPGAAR